MDTLTLCRTMESVCRQRASLASPRRERWLDEQVAWNERAHTAAARQFQGEKEPRSDTIFIEE
jgi:hypothetical protein